MALAGGARITSTTAAAALSSLVELAARPPDYVRLRAAACARFGP
jgi:hypothetical protein